MEAVYMILSDQGRAEAAGLLEKLQKRGRAEVVESLEKVQETVDNVPQSVEKCGFLILTDKPEEARAVLKEGFPLVYYEREGEETIFGPDLVILSLLEADWELFRKVYRRHFHLPWTIAKTRRLLIRESVPEDFDTMFELYQGEGMTRFIPSLSEDREKEREKFEAYIRYQYPLYGYGLWTLAEKNTSRIVGRMGFENREYKGEIWLELGYLVGKEYQNKGYATEAALCLAGKLAELTGSERAAIFLEKENLPSCKVARKVIDQYPESFRMVIDSFFP